jgi:predicted RecB family nuclease
MRGIPVERETMTAKITSEVLESYLQCKYKAYLKLAGAQGVSSDYELFLLETRNRIRLAATEKFEARHADRDILRSVPLTRALLKRGTSLLLDVTLEDDALSLRFDALQKEVGPSPLGDFHYIPRLFHEAEKPSRQQKDLLALHALLLGDLQGRQSQSEIVIYGRGCSSSRLRLNP